MAIQINGVDLDMQPSEHGWKTPSPLGNNGNGTPIYPALFEYELIFNLESAADFNDLMGYVNLISTTGSIVAGLPEWGAATYANKNYSGCFLQQPEFQGYFEEHHQEVRVRIIGIRV